MLITLKKLTKTSMWHWLKGKRFGRTLVLGCKDVEAAKAALAVCKDGKPVLNGADASNYEAMNAVAAEAGVVLSVTGADLNELYDTVAALEKAGNKNLILDVGCASVKDAFAMQPFRSEEQQ